MKMGLGVARGWRSAGIGKVMSKSKRKRRHGRYLLNVATECAAPPLGLIWLLGGREVVVLTEATATIRNPATGSVTVYRMHNRPALGPLGDSLEDLK